MTFSCKRSNPGIARKTGLTLRSLSILFLIAAISPLACTPATPTSLPASDTPTEVLNTPETGTTSPPTLTPEANDPTSTAEAATATASSGGATQGVPLLFVAEADAQVRESHPDKNYGSDTELRADGEGDSGRESFIRFRVNDAPDPIQEARLRIYVTDNGTDNGPAIYATDSSWDESSITWSNRPAPIGDALDNKDRLGSNSWVEYDVASVVTGNGTFSFVLVADSSDGVVFSSREGSQPPQLVLNDTGGNASTAVPTVMATAEGSDPVLIGAGDISECDNNNDELTAQILDATPGTVFTTGDTAYESGTIDEFNNCYDPTWGRHKDRTKPVPGNHEYKTNNASGYYEYFNNIPEYYAYDLGAWRIYALNSEIDVSESSSQVAWLKEDLAAHPAQCVLAYWHQPRWSSGSHHGSDNDYQTIWQIFYEAGAELVLNGHEHNYERFAEMNAEGAVSSPGLREIVVGTGGRDLYDFSSPLPASEVRNGTAYGVLKVTLHADGYDWEFIPIPGSTFTDSGSTSCH